MLFETWSSLLAGLSPNGCNVVSRCIYASIALMLVRRQVMEAALKTTRMSINDETNVFHEK